MPLAAAKRVTFRLSPFMETFWSMHVLQEPEHHRLNQNWVRGMRKKTLAIRRDLRRFSFAYRGAPTACGIPDLAGESGSFLEELARLRAATESEATRFFTRSFYRASEPIATGLDVPPQVEERFLVHAKEVHASSELAEAALAAPAKTLNSFADLVERYWYSGFDERWEHYRPLLERAIEDVRERIATRGGLPDFFKRLPLDVRVNPACDGFTVDRPHDHEVTIGPADRLVLTPSFMTWPHVRVSCERPGLFAIAFGPMTELDRLASVPPPDQLLRALEAIADDTRLRVLRFLSEVPRSTQELSALVSVTAPTLSEHLHKLEDSGVVRSHRDGHYMVYELNLDLDDISEKLRHYLNSTAEPS